MQEVQLFLPVGSVLRDRYVIEALLGQGGFGAVYRVRDQRVKGNLFALKEVIEPKRKDRTGKEKNHFHFESELLKQLDHRALPRVYRVFEDEVHGRAYMLLDFIDGPNLEVLRKQRPAMRFSLSQVLILMEPIIDAISYLHSQQPPIIHRDIKPSNIIVPAPQEAVLVDFDIAKEFDPDSTTTAVRRCSPGYGAPEQYGHGTSPLTDIYGSGATIYTLLSGQIPPDALFRMTMLGAKGRDPLVTLDELVPGITQKVAQAVQRAMSLHQSDRFSSIEQFWHELDMNATSLEVPALVATPSTRNLTNVERPVLPPGTELSTDPLGNAVNTSQGDREGSPLPYTRNEDDPLGNAGTVNTFQGDRKGSPLPYTRNEDEIRRSVIGAHSHGRPGRLAVLLGLLLLVICVGGVAGFWTFSEFPGTVFTRYTTSTLTGHATTVTQKVPTATGISGKHVPTATPIVSAFPPPTSVASHPNPTPIVTQPSGYSPTPTPQPTLTPVPNPYPTLAGGYAGTIVDTTPSPNITTKMYLSSIKQNKGSISGNFMVDAPLQGNGPFSGSVGTNDYFQFTVEGFNGGAPLYFWGFVQANSALQGQYCSLDGSGHCSANAGAGGYWNVVPGS